MVWHFKLQKYCYPSILFRKGTKNELFLRRNLPLLLFATGKTDLKYAE